MGETQIISSTGTSRPISIPHKIPIIFPDKLKDLSEQLAGITENLELNLDSRINELGGGPAGLDVSSDDFSAIKDQLTKIKSQVLPSADGLPVESGPMLANLEGALGDLKTQLGNTKGISSNQTTSFISGFDGIKDSFPKPTEIVQESASGKPIVSETTPEKKYSQGELDALGMTAEHIKILKFLRHVNRVPERKRHPETGEMVPAAWVWRDGAAIPLIPFGPDSEVETGDMVLSNGRTGHLIIVI